MKRIGITIICVCSLGLFAVAQEPNQGFGPALPFPAVVAPVPSAPLPANVLPETTPPPKSSITIQRSLTQPRGTALPQPKTPASKTGTVRIKDISTLEGVRDNELTGFGLVTGLAGTGGTGPLTRQFALNLLDRFGYRADPRLRATIAQDTLQKTNNLAVVHVTCKMPPFAAHGSKADVLVSVVDDATSLQGGQLVLTALEGIDGEVHAMASGPISIGGFSFSGAAASVSKNHANTGRIPNGASIEEPLETNIGQSGVIRFMLNNPDYETARRISKEINDRYHRVARALNAAVIEVIVPSTKLINLPGFIGEIGALRVAPDVVARVVINERTGTVVVGDNVRLSPVAITHANLSVVTSETAAVSQPNAFGQGDTTVVPQTQIDAVEEERAISVLNRTATVGDLANALNALGVTPRDLSSIFQQLKEAGALHATLEFR